MRCAASNAGWYNIRVKTASFRRGQLGADLRHICTGRGLAPLDKGRRFFMETIKMREPCRFCKTDNGYVEQRGGQNCVFCQSCWRHLYNAPKTELGQKARTVTTVHNGLKPKQRVRILERANARCELCGANDAPLHAGHILSVKDGLEMGLTEFELNSDENLMSLCEECNLGMGNISLSPRVYVGLLRRRLHGTK